MTHQPVFCWWIQPVSHRTRQLVCHVFTIRTIRFISQWLSNHNWAHNIVQSQQTQFIFKPRWICLQITKLKKNSILALKERFLEIETTQKRRAELIELKMNNPLTPQDNLDWLLKVWMMYHFEDVLANNSNIQNTVQWRQMNFQKKPRDSKSRACRTSATIVGWCSPEKLRIQNQIKCKSRIFTK